MLSCQLATSHNQPYISEFVANDVTQHILQILYSLPFWPLRFFFIWDCVLFVFWMVVFAIFAKMYIHEDAEGDTRIQQMKDAVWLDLVNWMLWLVSAIGKFFLDFS